MMILNKGGNFFAQLEVSRDAASDQDGVGLIIFYGEGEFFRENVGGGVLEGSGKIGDLLRREEGREFMAGGGDGEI